MKLKSRTSVDRDILDFLVDKVCLKFGTMPVKVLIGMKLFKRKQMEIEKTIESSTHFRYERYREIFISNITKTI